MLTSWGANKDCISEILHEFIILLGQIKGFGGRGRGLRGTIFSKFCEPLFELLVKIIWRTTLKK